MRTFLCKTQDEFNATLNELSANFLFGRITEDKMKADVQAYLGQNRRHYPEDAKFWTDHFRSLDASNVLTRAAATGN